MKKQIEIVTNAPVRPRSISKLWILIAGIVTIIYRNFSNRGTAPGMPPGTFSFARQTAFSFMADVKQISSEPLTGFEGLALAGFIIVLLAFIVVIARKMI